MGNFSLDSTHISGLTNFGNTCYANSLLQALASCPSFVEHICFLSKLCKISYIPKTLLSINNEKEDFLNKTPLINAMFDCLSALQPRNLGENHKQASALELLVILYKHKKSFSAFGEQQDVSEAYELILGCIIQESESWTKLINTPLASKQLQFSKILYELGKIGETFGSKCPRILQNTFAGVKKVQNSILHKMQVSHLVNTSPCEGLHAYSLNCEECGHVFATQFDKFTSLIVPIITAYDGDYDEVVSLEECLSETFKEDITGPITCPQCSLHKTLYSELNPDKEYRDIEDFRLICDKYNEENKKFFRDYSSSIEEANNNYRNVSESSSPMFSQRHRNSFVFSNKVLLMDMSDVNNEGSICSRNFEKEKSEVVDDILRDIAMSNDLGSKNYLYYKRILTEAGIVWRTMKSPVKKKTSLGKSPQVLCISLQRKLFDSIGYTKISDRITYPENLNISKYLLHPNTNRAEYSLKSIIIHHGNEEHGHYFTVRKVSMAYGRHQWMLASDDKVAAISEDAAFGMECSMLFYERNKD